MVDREAYEQKLRARLDEWKAEIDKLRARASQADADARLQYKEEIEKLEKRQADAREKLEQLRAAGNDAWEDLKAGAESAWSELHDAVSKATARFK